MHGSHRQYREVSAPSVCPLSDKTHTPLVYGCFLLYRTSYAEQNYYSKGEKQ